MQTIDLGTISIGGEDLGAPKRPEPTQAPRSPFPTREASRPVAPPAPVIREPAVREPACPAPTAREPVSRETPRARSTEEYCEECGASRPCNDDIYFEKCEDHKVCHIGDTVMEGQGRILDLTMCLKNVCPGKRVAVGIALSELDPRGNEYPRGMKTFTVPAHHHSYCADIPVEAMRFILPEDISVSGTSDSCGNRRHFTARVVAHYIDFNSATAGL